jgi:hypothetical protein
MAEVVGHLPSKHETLNSNPSTKKKKRKKTKGKMLITDIQNALSLSHSADIQFIGLIILLVPSSRLSLSFNETTD